MHCPWNMHEQNESNNNALNMKRSNAMEILSQLANVIVILI